MPKVFTSKTQKIGELGEKIAIEFLVKQSFSILDRNYTQKWGELDIVAEKNKKLYFIEVKSVSRSDFRNVNHETLDGHKPEDNMHPWKQKRMARTIQTYILSKKLEERDWQVDLLLVYLDIKNQNSIVKVVKDIIL